MEIAMADTVVHTGENSQEYIAYKLTLDINRAEGKDRHSRDEILNLYSECLQAVRLPHLRSGGKDKTFAR